MMNHDQVEVSPREQQVLNLLVQGCSNKEIGGQLNIALHAVKQHLRMLFLRAGIREGAKRVKLARYAHEDKDAVVTPCEGLNPKESPALGSVFRHLGFPVAFVSTLRTFPLTPSKIGSG